jgi:hypothetical protein
VWRSSSTYCKRVPPASSARYARKSDAKIVLKIVGQFWSPMGDESRLIVAAPLTGGSCHWKAKMS